MTVIASQTRHKLAEASFFLDKLDIHYYDELRNGLGDPTVGFYLSAFVSAARAVSWIMKSEYGGVPGWEEWWHSQKPDEAEAELLASFTKLRNKSQKAIPIVVDRQIQIGKGALGESVEMDLNMPRVRVTFTPVEGGSPFGSEVTGFTLSVPELGGGDLRLACHRYLDTLEALVTACDLEFGELGKRSCLNRVAESVAK